MRKSYEQPQMIDCGTKESRFYGRWEKKNRIIKFLQKSNFGLNIRTALMALIGLSISQFFMCSKYAAPKSSYHSRQLGCIAFRWNWFSSSSCSSSFIVEDEIVQLGLFSWQSVPKGEDEEEVKDRLFFLCRANCLAAACCCYCCLLVVHQILAIKATAAVDIY